MAAPDAPLVLVVCGGGESAQLERLNPAMVVVRSGATGASVLRWCEANGTPLVAVAGSDRLALRVAMTLADHFEPDEMRIGVAAFPGSGVGMVEVAAVSKVGVWYPNA